MNCESPLGFLPPFFGTNRPKNLKFPDKSLKLSQKPVQPTLSAQRLCINSSDNKPHARKQINSPRCSDRRAFLRHGGLAISYAVFAPRFVSAEAQFSTYKGPISLGYMFSYPSSWAVKKKPIRTHVSEVIVTDNKESSTSAGIVVDAIKIESIDKFGTPDDVGQKVVDVEMKKESVKNAFISSAKSTSKDGLTYYMLDYTVDSTRGVKRYLSKATVTGGQLYVFTAQAKVDNFNDDTDKTFTQMLDSFNVKKQYM